MAIILAFLATVSFRLFSNRSLFHSTSIQSAASEHIPQSGMAI
nr:MAG TPA: hypothetical protein [Caudoviricetes sp.]